MSTIQIRIDEKDKKASQKVLERLGLNLSSSIKLYLKQVIYQQRLPFEIVTENGLTPKREREILKASRDAKMGKNISKPMTPPEFIKYLDRL